MGEPRFLQDPAFRCLRMGDPEGFRRATADRQLVDFSATNLRGTDFRSIDLTRLVLRDCYLRDADFRGCDMRHMDLEGASLQNARISGAYLPANLDPQEVMLSIQYGTRLRTRKA